MNDTTTTPAASVEIPADVRDNSETVTDYAHMGHRAPDKGIRTPEQRDSDIKWRDTFGYVLYTWYDVNQGDRLGYGAGQRCRFDMLVHINTGQVRHLFHTEYFTRVPCARGEWCHSYAEYFVRQEDPAGNLDTPEPYCGEHTQQLIGERLDPAHHEYNGADGMVYYLSEHLYIGQHD